MAFKKQKKTTIEIHKEQRSPFGGGGIFGGGGGSNNVVTEREAEMDSQESMIFNSQEGADNQEHNYSNLSREQYSEESMES